MLGNVRSVVSLVRHRGRRDGEVPIPGGGLMARRARKGKARKKKRANHGKRPTAR
ncbi:50S ribosomal protein bL37 [Nonomuraea pusilla]|uniref:50S ribosomal protein bL37 n=1 Tax=Nonomuraea pusilla TaxID=46177 RepID=UPI003D9EF1DC